MVIQFFKFTLDDEFGRLKFDELMFIIWNK